MKDKPTENTTEYTIEETRKILSYSVDKNGVVCNVKYLEQ
jgi:hypothetical protein